jgi:hypothetical protein
MESIAITPNQDDILCGSCYESLNHKGNAKFGRIVAKNFQEYYTAVSKMDKMLAAKGILSEIIASGAQFLKKDTSSRCWYIADVKVGKDKISHVLRIIERAKEKKGESSSQSAAVKASFSEPQLW